MAPAPPRTRMTFSICVREPYEVAPAATDEAGNSSGREEAGDSSGPEGAGDDVAETADPATHYRFGVAVTTRLPAVGVLCPFANGHGAIATQSRVNVDLGRKGVGYLADGLGIEGACEALLEADDGAPERQLHGVDRHGEFAFSGDECNPWYGDVAREGSTVAGNLLTGEAVVRATADAYADLRVTGEPDGSVDTDRDGAVEHDSLAARLVEALAAGQAEGGDNREELTVQSAAVVVATSEDVAREELPLYDDLRVDATETPVEDLRETVATTIETQAFLEERAADAEEQEDDDSEHRQDGE